MIQTAGYQAILHGHARCYRSHILTKGKWIVWHGTARQGAFPPQVDWRQQPTQAYYMAADLTRPAATLAVAQCGQQSPKWWVCMFSPADEHIAVFDSERQ